MEGETYPKTYPKKHDDEQGEYYPQQEERLEYQFQ